MPQNSARDEGVGRGDYWLLRFQKGGGMKNE